MKILKNSLKKTIRNHKKRSRRDENICYYSFLVFLIIVSIFFICVIQANALTREECKELAYDIDPKLNLMTDSIVEDVFSKYTLYEFINHIKKYINDNKLHTHKLLCTKNINYEFDYVIENKKYYIIHNSKFNNDIKIKKNRTDIIFKYYYVDILCYYSNIPLYLN